MSGQMCGAAYPGGGWDLRCRLDAGHAGAHRGDWGWQWGQRLDEEEQYA